MRVGIFGGTFNPPHIGHLVCVQEARWQLELDSLVLVPVGEAPHKQIAMEPGREARYELCRRAVLGREGLDVSRLEIDRDGPSYTLDTLQALREESPADELHLILGADGAAALGSWHEPAQVLKLAMLAVAERDGARRAEVLDALGELGVAERARFFSMPRIDLSSTLVRERVAAGKPFRHLVPEAVADYIEEAGLYAGVRTGERGRARGRVS